MVTKLLFRLLPIQILLAAVGAVNGIVSSFFASNYVGVTAMTAVGLYGPIGMLITSISTILVGGSAILCGKYIGQNQQEKMQNVFSLNLAVSLLILWGGYGTAKATVDLLLGQKPDPELLKSIADTVMDHEGVMGVHDLIVHDYGPGRKMITLHAEVDEDADMLSTHDMIDNIEWELNEKYNCLSTIHMDPIAVNNPETDAAKEQVKTALLRIDERITIHDFRLVRGQTHTNLVFDISAPYDIQLSDAELKARAVAEITAIDETFNPVITIDRR